MNTTKAELEAEIHKVIDVFTEPEGGEKYISDLVSDLMGVFSKAQLALLDEVEKGLPKYFKIDKRDWDKEALRGHNNCLDNVQALLTRLRKEVG